MTTKAVRSTLVKLSQLTLQEAKFSVHSPHPPFYFLFICLFFGALPGELSSETEAFDLHQGIKILGGKKKKNLFKPFAEKGLKKLLQEFTLRVESISKY